MLFIKKPFTPIFRLIRAVGTEMVECETMDMEAERMRIITILWDAVSSDDAGELAGCILNTAAYEPTIEKFRWWIDENWSLYT